MLHVFPLPLCLVPQAFHYLHHLNAHLWGIFCLVCLQPTMTWGQPPFYVHQMIKNSLQPNAVAWSMSSSDAYNASNLNGIISSQVSDDGTNATIRFVNPRIVPVILNLSMVGRRGCTSFASSASLTVLHSANLFDANTPAEPTKVSPVTRAISDLRSIQVPPGSFAIITTSGFQCE